MSRRLKIACANLDARPLFWTDDNGQRQGFEPELAETVFADADLEFEWTFLPWIDFLPAVAEGRVDGVWCGQGIIPERLKLVDFTDPYTVFNESVIVRAGEPVTTSRDLADKRVGAIADSANMRLARTFQDAVLIPFDGATNDVLGDMVAALRNGDVDAIVDDDVALITVANAPDIDLAFTVETRNPWGMCVRQGNDELRKTINAALTRVKADGRLKAIWSRWVPGLQYPF